MTIRINELLRGYAFILVLNRNVLHSAASQCRTEKINDTLKAICTDLTLEEIPTDLNAKIEYLDLSGSKINSLMTRHSFKQYKKLKWLSVRGCIFSNPDKSKNVNKDEEVFKPLEHLEYLDMSGLVQNGFPNYKWPRNIRILKVNKTGVPKKLDVTAILKLEYVDVSDTEIISFPLLNSKAPTKVVLINGVSAMFTSEDIAPFCHITTLEMKLSSESSLTNSIHFCDCMRLVIWKSKCNINTNNVACNNDKQHSKTCELSDESFTDCINMRKKCFGAENYNLPFFLIFSALFLMVAAIITTAIAYRYANLRYHFKPISQVEANFNEEGGEEGGVEDETEALSEPA